MSPATVCHARGFHTIEKPRCIGCKPKVLCRICKGNHLTHLFHATSMVQEAQSFSDIPSGSESSFVSQHPNPCLIDTMVILMQSSANTTPILRSEASFDHVINISSLVSSEQGRIPLSPSNIPPITREFSFDCNDLVEHQLLSSTPIQIRGIIQYIV
jgi:hypothetical protein